MRFGIAIGALLAAASAAEVSPRGYGHKPLVDSKKLQKSIKEKALLKGAKALQSHADAFPPRNRLMGGAGHNETVKYLVKELKKLDYYNIELQPFSALVQLNGTASLTLDGEVVEPGQFDYSPSGNGSAKLIVVNNLGCEPADYPAELTGNIALISRGSCEFGLKSVYAGNAGAIGAIIYDNIPGGPIEGTLGTPPRPEGEYIATIGLSLDQGKALAEKITGGAEVSATFDVVTDIQIQTTNNVIATSKSGSHDTVLVVGAHTDSVRAGPGINDDGSGTIGILEVAKQLSKYKVNNAVRFGFWSGEEEGLLGSTHYVEHASPKELSSIRAYLNFDMIASPNYVHALYDGDGSAFNLTGPAGSAEIEKFFEEWFASVGQNTTATEFNGRSDYAAFIDAGIPAGGTFTGAEEIKTEEEAELFGGVAGEPLDKYYHDAGDDVNNLALDAFVLHTQAIAASVAKYATSFDSLPPKANVTRRSVPAAKREVKRHSHGSSSCKKIYE
ncbi:Zn-dependent exopeptidase [Aaosphaeria arxii CBS 175.79]|uniref:Peptide hydrolase n=1 Tax=Aaosphaeria arxii CBS 175.79 TaxID=1450172 RepID=A0A6A5XUR5_9PLEO|nr:Zn-dependent exopeptidase [Aaosphaeria arxii CBS 175.79]KAF2016547.1 Zn-dependent exopeptidase [Aaosphaeria arxii CBS 175.79]